MHTPGPWRFVEQMQTDMGGFVGLDDAHVCSFGDCATYYPTEGCPPSEADARLIAAAPDLLAALSDLRESTTEAYKSGRIPAEPFVRAGNVIAKAEGR